MPLLVSALIGGLIQASFTLVGRVLIALGFSYLTMTGVDASLDWIRGAIASSMGGLPSDVVSLLGAFRVGSAVSIVLSAITARLIFDGMTGGTIRKMVLK